MFTIAVSRPRLTALLLTVLARSSTAGAQWTQRVAIEGVIGEAVGWGGEYTSRVLAAGRLSAQARVGRVGGLSVIASLERDRVFTNGDLIDVCTVGSRGQCLPEYPLFAGWMFGAGLRTPTTRRGVITVSTGLGRQQSIDRRGDRPDDASVAWMIHGDGALQIWRGLWLTAGVRRTEIKTIYNDALNIRAITLGLRAGSQAP